MASLNTDVSFAKYDSSAYATFTESINNAKTNPLQLYNLSDRVLVEFEKDEYTIQEPVCTLKDMFFYFEPYIDTIDVDPSEMYRPELVALRLYNNADLWYILMICNKIYSVTQFNLSNIKYIPAKDLAKIQKFISLSYQRTRTITDRDSFDYKYDSWSATSLFDTLRPSSSWSNVTLDTSGMDRLYIFANVTMYHDFTMNWTPVFKDIYAAIFDFTEEWTDELYNLANVTLPEGTGAFYNYLPKS